MTPVPPDKITEVLTLLRKYCCAEAARRAGIARSTVQSIAKAHKVVTIAGKHGPQGARQYKAMHVRPVYEEREVNYRAQATHQRWKPLGSGRW